MQLFTILLILASASAVFAGCPDQKKFRLCYNTYFESYDLASSPLPDYRAFKMVREMLLVRKGPTAQILECNYQKTLISCLGNMVDTCVTKDNFKAVYSTSDSNAMSYVEDYHMMQYTCTAGFNYAIKYFYCMEQIGLYYPTKLMNCTQDKGNALSGSNPNICKIYDNYVTCLTAAFVEHCGADIIPYICNLRVVSALAVVPQCKNQLQKCPAPTTFI